jgi:PAS domain S-box-containing protein
VISSRDRIMALTARVRTMADGNTPPPITTIGDGEIGELGELEREVNRMVRASRADLQERLLFLVGPVVMFRWINAEGWPVEYVSPNITALTGYPVEDFASGRRPYASLIHQDDLPRVLEEVAANSKNDSPWFRHQPYRVLRADGAALWVADYTVILRDGAGTITHYFGYIMDISEQVEQHRRLEQERRHVETAAELDRAKTEFFTNVSHEFRTPLTLILGPLEALLGGALDASQRDTIETAWRNALRLQKLVNALLDFSRIEAGRASARFEPTDLASFTRGVASFFASAARAAGLDFAVDCPPHGEPVWVDRDMWEKLVSNLLSNALKFTLKGAIRLRLRASDDAVRLEVEDTGVGIPEAELPRIFERFHRVQGTRARSQEGSGIGLALTNELVRLHGGTLSVHSTEGVGTTFTVAIPRGHAHLPAEHVSTTETRPPAPRAAGAYATEASSWIADEPDAPAAGATAGSRPRVVLADDNADMRAYIGRMLRGSYEVDAHADGLQALEAIRRRLPDIVITDVMMPGMGGFELLAALRADVRTRALPILIVSARAGEEARVEGIEAGADDYLVKPFSPRELLARMRTQWALAQMRQELARQAERVTRLEGEQRWLEAVLDRTPIPLALFELEGGRATFANRAADALAGGTFPLGIPRAEYPRHYHLTDEHGGELPLDQWPPVRAARGEKVEGQMVAWQSPAGPIPVLASGESLPATNDHAAAIVLAFQDVTELVRAIRARDEFLSIASHELKTPLTSLRMQVQQRERALAKGNLSAFAPEVLTRTLARDVRQIDRLTRLVDDILDVSRISTGRFALAICEPVDLVALVRDVLERSADALATAGCPVTLEGPASVTGRWDRGRIEQVVLNLLTNAWKYGGGKPIHCTVRSRGDRAVLAIRDEGIGISAADQQRIFQIFERAVSKDECSGLGLGLHIARRIVDAHGGAINVESAPGKGATFTVELPLDPPTATGARP